MLSTYPRTEVFIDGFTFTTPKENSSYTHGCLMGFLSEYGFIDNGNGGILAPNTGLIRISHRHMVTSYHVNGQCCSWLRSAGIYGHFLGCIYQLEHYRITRADFTVDVSFPAYLLLDELDRLLISGDIKFNDGKVATHNGRPLEYTQERHRSGGLYFNSRKSERCGKVYDKTLERLTRSSEVIPPTTRIELTLSNKLGLSIADLNYPAPFFYRHVPPALLDTPSDVPEWQQWGEVAGFKLVLVNKTPGQRLRLILDALQPLIAKASSIIEKESSPELKAYFISRLIAMLEPSSLNMPTLEASS